MDFAISGSLVRCWRLISASCPSTRTFAPRFFQTPPRGGLRPCASLVLHLHQVAQRTFTSKLLNMPGTPLNRCRDSRCAGARSRVWQPRLFRGRFLTMVIKAHAQGRLAGKVRPSASAVLRLRISSKRVACSTGRSLGLEPLRILSRRNPRLAYTGQECSGQSS